MSETLHPEEAVTTIFLVRHGKTEAVEKGLLHADLATPLSPTGVEQAQAMASFLTKLNADVLLSSRAIRVLKTAEVIAGQSKLKPIVNSQLDEWLVGDWEGKTYLQIKKTQPDLYDKWQSNPIFEKVPGGESIAGMYDRVVAELKVLVEEHVGKRVILVTHAGVIRSMLVYALGMPLANFWRLNVPTASVSQIDFSANFSLVKFMALEPATFAGGGSDPA